MNIGGYEVIRLLGKGGMSEVYEVENPRAGSRHALKLYTYGQEDPEVLERFKTEGRLLAKLSHPRIVQVTDVGTDAATGRPFFVMDLVCDAEGEAKSLASVEPGAVDEETVGRWYDDIREGLAYIHARGVVHRDLKLQNVLIGPDGHAVLTDFGISRVFDAKGDGKPIVDTVQTIVKMREGRSLVMGSIGYMAPELEMGVAASPQSDWYALGVIVYRLLTGTWCDARTDVVDALDSYEPVWTRIIPKLLHSNPNGRACPAYAEEREADRLAAEAAWEDRVIAAEGRLVRFRRLAVAAGLALLAVAAVCAVDGFRQRQKAAAGSAAVSPVRSPYDFNELFRIPPEAGAEEVADEDGNLLMPSGDDLAAARLDALVATWGDFTLFRSGDISAEALRARLEALRDSFAEDSEETFDDWPEGYLQLSNDDVFHWLLSLAVERLDNLIEGN